MPFRYRKRLKLAPGIRLNITQRGISSISLGGSRESAISPTVNVNSRGIKTTVSAPGTGFWWESKRVGISSLKSAANSRVAPRPEPEVIELEDTVAHSKDDITHNPIGWGWLALLLLIGGLALLGHVSAFNRDVDPAPQEFQEETL